MGAWSRVTNTPSRSLALSERLAYNPHHPVPVAVTPRVLGEGVRLRRLLVAGIAALLAGCSPGPLAAQKHGHVAGPAEGLGTVHFPTSCLRNVAPELEAVWAKQPNHPGLAHYIIHSYDVPALAPRAAAAVERDARRSAAFPEGGHGAGAPDHG